MAKPAKSENYTVFIHTSAHFVRTDLKQGLRPLTIPGFFYSLSGIPIIGTLPIFIIDNGQ